MNPIAEQPQANEEPNALNAASEFSAEPVPQGEHDSLCCGGVCQVLWKPSRTTATPFEL